MLVIKRIPNIQIINVEINAGVIPWNKWNSALTLLIPLIAVVAGSTIDCVNNPGNNPKTTTSTAKMIGDNNINIEASCAF